MSDEDAVTRAVGELYALDPGDFVAARDEAARTLRAAGDKSAGAAVKKLTRPTVAAWAVNQLVRANPQLTGRLAALGERLREAQSAFDAAELKRLRPERDALLDDAVRATATVAAARGQQLGAAADDVRGTFVAALADPAATAAVLSGRLVRPLSYAGFGEVQLTDAVADLPGPPPGQVDSPTDPASSPPESRTPAPGRRRSDTKRTAEPVKGAAAEQAARRAAEQADRDRAEKAVTAAHDVLQEAEREAEAAALADIAAQDAWGAARRRTEEIRGLLAATERDEQAAADRAQAAADDARISRERVTAATAAWEAATADRERLG